ncbi:MAG: hypothetical protein HYW49_00805 [Deltaproteobacteria bacterium]|nr:hypothetical protein [Deltaproteobacteria bacterium]
MENASSQTFVAVDEASLKEGMILDRPLYIFLERNQRFVRLANALHPLEERVFSKLRKSGKIFSTIEPSETRYPRLTAAAKNVRALCEDRDAAPFEKNRETRAALKPVIEIVFQNDADGLTLNEPVAAVLFMHLVLGVPAAGTLRCLEDRSVEAYERGIKCAAVCGIFALLLGYADTGLLRQYISAVFCSELHALGDAEVSLPEKFDVRFSGILDGAEADTAGASNDELRDLMAVAREVAAGSIAPVTRAYRKIRRLFAAASAAAPPEALGSALEAAA